MGRMEMALLWRPGSLAPGGHSIRALSQQFNSAASEGGLLPPHLFYGWRSSSHPKVRETPSKAVTPHPHPSILLIEHCPSVIKRVCAHFGGKVCN